MAVLKLPGASTRKFVARSSELSEAALTKPTDLAEPIAEIPRALMGLRSPERSSAIRKPAPERRVQADVSGQVRGEGSSSKLVKSESITFPAAKTISASQTSSRSPTEKPVMQLWTNKQKAQDYPKVATHDSKVVEKPDESVLESAMPDKAHRGGKWSTAETLAGDTMNPDSSSGNNREKLGSVSRDLLFPRKSPDAETNVAVEKSLQRHISEQVYVPKEVGKDVATTIEVEAVHKGMEPTKNAEKMLVKGGETGGRFREARGAREANYVERRAWGKDSGSTIKKLSGVFEAERATKSVEVGNKSASSIEESSGPAFKWVPNATAKGVKVSEFPVTSEARTLAATAKASQKSDENSAVIIKGRPFEANKRFMNALEKPLEGIEKPVGNTPKFGKNSEEPVMASKEHSNFVARTVTTRAAKTPEASFGERKSFFETTEKPVGGTEEKLEPGEGSVEIVESQAVLTLPETEEGVEKVDEKPIESIQQPMEKFDLSSGAIKERIQVDEKFVQAAQTVSEPTEEPSKAAKQLMDSSGLFIGAARKSLQADEKPVEVTFIVSEAVDEPEKSRKQLVERSDTPMRPVNESMKAAAEAVQVSQAVAEAVDEPAEATNQVMESSAMPPSTAKETMQLVEEPGKGSELETESAAVTPNVSETVGEEVGAKQPMGMSDAFIGAAKDNVQVFESPLKNSEEDAKFFVKPVEAKQSVSEGVERRAETVEYPMECSDISIETSREAMEVVEGLVKAVDTDSKLYIDPVEVTRIALDASERSAEATKELVESSDIPIVKEADEKASKHDIDPGEVTQTVSEVVDAVAVKSLSIKEEEADKSLLVAADERLLDATKGFSSESPKTAKEVLEIQKENVPVKAKEVKIGLDSDEEKVDEKINAAKEPIEIYEGDTTSKEELGKTSEETAKPEETAAAVQLAEKAANKPFEYAEKNGDAEDIPGALERVSELVDRKPGGGVKASEIPVKPGYQKDRTKQREGSQREASHPARIEDSSEFALQNSAILKSVIFKRNESTDDVLYSKSDSEARPKPVIPRLELSKIRRPFLENGDSGKKRRNSSGQNYSGKLLNSKPLQSSDQEPTFSAKRASSRRGLGETKELKSSDICDVNGNFESKLLGAFTGKFVGGGDESKQSEFQTSEKVVNKGHDENKNKELSEAEFRVNMSPVTAKVSEKGTTNAVEGPNKMPTESADDGERDVPAGKVDTTSEKLVEKLPDVEMGMKESAEASKLLSEQSAKVSGEDFKDLIEEPLDERLDVVDIAEEPDESCKLSEAVDKPAEFSKEAATPAAAEEPFEVPESSSLDQESQVTVEGQSKYDIATVGKGGKISEDKAPMEGLGQAKLTADPVASFDSQGYVADETIREVGVSAETLFSPTKANKAKKAKFNIFSKLNRK